MGTNRGRLLRLPGVVAVAYGSVIASQLLHEFAHQRTALLLGLPVGAVDVAECLALVCRTPFDWSDLTAPVRLVLAACGAVSGLFALALYLLADAAFRPRALSLAWWYQSCMAFVAAGELAIAALEAGVPQWYNAESVVVQARVAPAVVVAGLLGVLLHIRRRLSWAEVKSQLLDRPRG
ncbi:MAG: hypothetical protein FJ318_04140 [SAR202 cluster bacterium]|nr:hypothetical protein [SAR202 cluster bacterium]